MMSGSAHSSPLLVPRERGSGECVEGECEEAIAAFGQAGGPPDTVPLLLNGGGFDCVGVAPPFSAGSPFFVVAAFPMVHFRQSLDRLRGDRFRAVRGPPTSSQTIPAE